MPLNFLHITFDMAAFAALHSAGASAWLHRRGGHTTTITTRVSRNNKRQHQQQCQQQSNWFNNYSVTNAFAGVLGDLLYCTIQYKIMLFNLVNIE